MSAIGRWLTATVAVSAMLFSSGCIPEGLAFREDHRLTIEAPGDRSEITVPFEVAWTLDAPRVEERHFAVLVDRFPPRPGTSIESLLPAELREPARCDQACRTAALASRDVFVTDSSDLVISRLPVRHGVSDEQQRRHEVSVIVLDDRLRRVGESVAWIEVDVAEVTS